MSDSHDLSQISALMDRLVAANEKYMRSQLRLVFLPYAGSRSPGGLGPNERVTIAIPRKGESGAPPAGAYVVPQSAMQDCSESDFWGAVGVASESGESGRLVLLISGGLASDEAAEEFNRLAAESGRLYQTLPPSLAPIHGTTSPRNLWAAVLYGWLRETRWVGEEDGFEFVGLPFAASAELWRRLLYGTTPDGRVGTAPSPSKPRSSAEVLRMNQLGDPSRIPHSLSVAHASLIEALTRSGDLYRRELRFSNPAPVLDAIERFVHELKLIPACFQELLRRSSLVEDHCASGSPYHNARQAALTSHAGTPTNLSGAKLALEKVRSDSTEHPLFLQEVVDTRKAIERLLADRQTAGLSPNAVAAFQPWGAECRDIQLEAERLHVDGCWYLNQIYQSSEAAPSERAQTARAILQTDMGGAHLREIGLAVDSILAWAIENASPNLESQPIAAGIEVDGSLVVDEPLGERCQLALIAMLELGATDSDHRRSTEEIATKALGSQADANALKNVMSELNTRELIDSKPGRGGGCWLTEKGRARAEKLRKV